jgi:hypothetical protein
MQSPWKTIPRYQQRLVHLEGEIAAPAQLVWDVLNRWGDLLTWLNAVPDPNYPLVSADLLAGRSEEMLPRTRRCVFDLARLTGVVPEEGFDVLANAGPLPGPLLRALKAAVTGTALAKFLMKLPFDRWLAYDPARDARSCVTVHAEAGIDGRHRSGAPLPARASTR